VVVKEDATVVEMAAAKTVVMVAVAVETVAGVMDEMGRVGWW